MAITFPTDPGAQTPVNTFSPTSSPVVNTTNNNRYLWNGVAWTVQNDSRYVNIAGDTMTGNLTVPSINGGPLAGFRNQLIGGCFRIWQRGTVGSINGTAYRPDRWQATTVGAGQVQRRTAPNDLPFDYVCEFTANGNGFRQGIELSVNDAGSGQPGPFVPGTTWTLSVYATWDMSGITPVIAFRDTLSSASGQTVLDSSASNYQAVGPAVDGYTRYSTTITIDAGVTPGTAPMLAVVLIPNGTIPESARIGGVQFEQSSVPTPLEHRPYATELALCQRYFNTSFVGGASANNSDNSGQIYMGGSKGQTATTSFIGTATVYFPTSMRTAPSVSSYDMASPRNIGKCHRHTYGTSGQNNQSVNVAQISGNSFVLRSDSGNSATGIIFHYVADAEL